MTTIDTAYAMLDLAALSFLGLGVQPPTADWGTMLSEGQLVLLTSPHLAVASGLAAHPMAGFDGVGGTAPTSTRTVVGAATPPSRCWSQTAAPARIARKSTTGTRADEPRTWPEGSEWLIDDVLYRSEVVTRREAVPEHGEWKPVWDVMAALAPVHGDENVRLIVWFDN